MFVRTERLLIRPGFIEDAPALAAGIGDLAVARNLASVPMPYSLDDAAAFLSGEVRPNELSGLIFMRTGDAPRLAGGIGLNPVTADQHDWGTGPAMELGYWIARPYWGLGIATEAGRAMVAHARARGISRIVAGHFADNPASGKVLRKLGFKPLGRTAQRHSTGRGGNVTCILFDSDDGECDVSSGTDMPALADFIYPDSGPLRGDVRRLAA